MYDYYCDTITHSQLTKEMVDSHQRYPYPQMIVLKVTKAPDSSSCSPSIPVNIMGIKEGEMKFILNPKVRQSCKCIFSHTCPLDYFYLSLSSQLIIITSQSTPLITTDICDTEQTL